MTAARRPGHPQEGAAQLPAMYARADKRAFAAAVLAIDQCRYRGKLAAFFFSLPALLPLSGLKPARGQVARSGEVPAQFRVAVSAPAGKVHDSNRLSLPGDADLAGSVSDLDIAHMYLQVINRSYLHAATQARQRQVEYELIAPSVLRQLINPGCGLRQTTNQAV